MIQRVFVLRFIATVLLLSLATQPIGFGNVSDYTGPLFDIHLHQTNSLALTDLIALVRKAGLTQAALLGPPPTDTNAVLLAEQQSVGFLYPFASIPRDATRDLFNSETARLLEEQLKDKTRYGIGEVALRHRSGPSVPGSSYPADGPVVLQIYDLGARYKVPVLVHVEHEFSAELERGLEHNRSAIIIWAHMGDGQPSLVRDMLKRHANLYLDISSRNPYFRRGMPLGDQSLTNPDGSLKNDWKLLFEEYADRILLGIDLNNERYTLLVQLISYYRSVLGQLTPPTAEKIAYKNAQKLLKL